MTPATSPDANLLTTRRHRIQDARLEQVTRNLLAIRGGRNYVAARLWRAPNESDLSWEGTSVASLGGQTNTVGRKDRAHLVNEAGRIAAKINQYIFAERPARTGIDPAFAANVTATGQSIGAFWEAVSEAFTAAGWAWIQVDRGAMQRDPETGAPVARTRAQAEAAGDRLRWAIWRAQEVPDWSFDDAGRLAWILTAETWYENADPMAPAVARPIRTLWRRARPGEGSATWERFALGDDDKLTPIASGTVSSAEIPFVCVGTPSADPWWFDDVEMIQAVLLNLGSLHTENLMRTVFPQLVVPASMVDNLEATLRERATGNAGGGVSVELVREIIRGVDRPMIEGKDDKGVTRYLMPSGAELEATPRHAERLRQALFDMVGLALFNRETRQVASAEAKQFDHLDTEATLRHRANVLQDAEVRLIAVSREIQADFPEYQPDWPTAFNVPQTAEDVAALTQLANFAPLTPGLRKRMLKAALALLGEIDTIPPDERQELLDEIDLADLDADGVGAAVRPAAFPAIPPGT
jgi:hypothetical protein